jgi:cold shock CspA family protein
MVTRKVVATGEVKWYDPDKNYGLIAIDGGGQAGVASSALTSTKTLRPGQRVELVSAKYWWGLDTVQVRIVEQPVECMNDGGAEPVT